MGGRTPEICWAVNKRQDNKLENCCIWLVIYLNWTTAQLLPFLGIQLNCWKKGDSNLVVRNHVFENACSTYRPLRKGRGYNWFNYIQELHLLTTLFVHQTNWRRVLRWPANWKSISREGAVASLQIILWNFTIWTGETHENLVMTANIPAEIRTKYNKKGRSALYSMSHRRKHKKKIKPLVPPAITN